MLKVFGGQRCHESQSRISFVRIARQAINQTRPKMFQIFRQGENEVFIASKARWDEQLKGLIELERRCLTLREEVEHLSERQEVLTDVMESKMNMQKTAPKKYQEKIFEELKELEEHRAKEALALVQLKHKLIKWDCESKDHANVGGVRRPRSHLP